MAAEIAIVGGGLAGCAAAIALAEAGRDVVLMERESGPHHKVCGEFLSQEAVELLHSMGVDPSAYGAAKLHSVRLAHAGKVTDSALPFMAMSLTRKRLDEELLRMAERAGVRVVRGARVTSLQVIDNKWFIGAVERPSIEAETVFLATGKHDVAGRPRPAGKQSGMVGFKMYYRLGLAQAAELAGHVELALFRGGYGGLQPVEDGAANLCCVVHHDELQRLSGKWERLLEAMKRDCPLLRERLDGAVPLLERPLAISHIPYGFVRQQAPDGVWCLGDQAAVIPSFTGDGMSIALHSGRLAAEMYLAGQSAAMYQRRLQTQVGQQVALATMVSKGLVWGPSRGVFVQMVRMWPSLLGIVAKQTRIREQFRLA
jgi:flavin-dependent dehydrogenase